MAWVAFPGLPFNAANIYELSLPGLLALLFWVGAGIVAVFSRYQQLTSFHQRQQTRLFAVSAIVGVTAYVLYAAPLALFPTLRQPGATSALYTMIGSFVSVVAAILTPLLIFVSIQRYQFFDIEVFINRALIYGALTGTLALVYLGLVFALQFLLRGFIGQTNTFSVVISTLAVAALFQPLRRGIQRVIVQRFYRRKYDAAKTLAAFSATLRSAVDLDQLHEQLEVVVQETMQPRYVSLWLVNTTERPMRNREAPLSAHYDDSRE